ncbi:DHA2 family efflux MFS transporter permease subunit [Raineyella fluvialis]|uniref:DHA2 family efflux MFS transporter permease subunit n=1 Tax=Raineyella fluvialis TaxID=2662261 RepID=A0A5Q2FAZ6_9ACTN|nr:DHA2 family efflux MFS transporter permease subunit [Raineyella fluvialis]QGF24190.1 DHA2 family efflux MFS transporter permease subunit [Raineyella fluvialis]
MSRSVTSPTAQAPAGLPRTTARDNLVINLLLVSAFVVILNETVMGVAIPRLMTDLRVTAVAAQWLTTAFMLTMATVIPITGMLIQRFPTRGLFITAMSLFSLGTAVAALAPGYGVLLVGRIIQASGTAIVMPLLMTTVMTLVPPQVRGQRMGNISVVISVAPAIGPTISGLVLSLLSWRFMFVLVLPIAVTSLALGALKMPNVTEPVHAPIDAPSVVLSALGFGGLVFGLSSLGTSAGKGAPTLLIGTLAVGVAALALFVWRQLALQRADRALLDLRTFRSPVFAVSVTMFVVCMMALFGTLILLPLFLQNVLGMTVLHSGLLLLPGGLVMGLLAPAVGRLFDRFGPLPLLVPGTTLVAGVLWVLAVISTSLTPWVVLLVAHVVLSIGLALIFTPLFTSSLGALPQHLYSHGSATVSTIQQVSGAAGTALFVSTMAATAAGRAAAGVNAVVAESAGIRAAFLVGAILSTVAIITSFFIRRPAGPSEPVADQG